MHRQQQLISIILIVFGFSQSTLAFHAGKKAMRDLDAVLDKRINEFGEVLVATGVTLGDKALTASTSSDANTAIENIAATAGASFAKAAAAAVSAALQAQVVAGTVAAKGALIIAAPYVAGSVAVGGVVYGGYKYYQSRQPSKEKVENERAHRELQSEKALEQCLTKNAKGKLNKHGVPVTCDAFIRKFALIAGKKRTKEKLEAYKIYA